MADDANSSLPPVPGDGRGLLPLWGEAPLYIGALLLCFVVGCYAMGWLLVLCHTLGLFYIPDAYLLLLVFPPFHQIFMGILTIAACIVMALALPASCVSAARRFGRHALWATGILFTAALAISAVQTWIAC